MIKIENLDDAPDLNVWTLDKTFTGTLDNTMPSYEEAMVYVETLSDKRVGLRAVVDKRVVCWDVYKRR